jgi:glycerophosphoryl diester phosphodiesterase
MHYALNTVTSSLSANIDHHELFEQQSFDSKSIFQSPRRKLFLGILTLFLVVNVYYTLGIIRHGSILQSSSLNQTTVTSHRGYSSVTPENTIVAIEKAIEVFADVVEFDVRVTSDSQFVLLHDDNLLRTTGLNMSVIRLTLDSIQELDAGKWFSSDFEGTRIPTLQEALETTKGRINVNLDLKLNENQIYLLPRLVEIIDEYEMQFQIVITSTCFRCLHVIKELNPNIQTGYITYRITPSLLNDLNIDVLSVKASFVTQSMVDQIHQSGKQIFVWTVNTRAEIERMRNLGVNNIITSRPTYVKEVLFELSADRFILNLIRIILN